jgi:hypothetical protein
MATQGTARGNEGLEKQLMHILRFSGIEENNLKELVGIVVGLQSKGLENFRVFPRGVPPVVDGLNIQATVGAANLGNLLSSIVLQTPRLNGVSIFPYGIINPEAFQVNVALGNTIEAGASETAAGL